MNLVGCPDTDTYKRENPHESAAHSMAFCARWKRYL